MDVRAVLDTDMLVAAIRSRDGASNAILRLVERRRFIALASVALFMEYEAVLTRAEHLIASGHTAEEIGGFLDYLAGLIEPVELFYLWRPQLDDVADEMVLETAINGRADLLVTFNATHFRQAARFGIDVVPPREMLRRLA